MTIRTDSRYARDGITRNLCKWEDKGWIGVASADADPRFTVLGMKLSMVTQALAYRNIKARKTSIEAFNVFAPAPKGQYRT